MTLNEWYLSVLIGLLYCQVLDEKALDFANNAYLTEVNFTKVCRKQIGTPFSIGQIKSQMINDHFIRKFLNLAELTPTKLKC